MPHHHVVTDFSQYTLTQLNQMLDQSDPATCQNAAETWDSTAQLLTEQVQNLQVQMNTLDPTWTGTAATDYKQMMTDLVGGIQQVANTAFTMRDLMYDAFDALTTARAEMPGPSSAVVPPGTLTLATTPVPYGDYLSSAAAAELEQQQASAQQAVAAASSAQAKAVAVMQTLAGSYVTAQNGIPPSPGGALPTVPTSSTSGSSAASTGAASVTVGAGALLTPVSAGTTTSVTGATTGSQSSTLFGDMFTVGLAAAAAVTGTGLLTSGSSSSQPSGSNPGTASPDEGAGAVGAGGDAGASVPDPGVGADPGQAASAASSAADAATSGAGSEPMMPMMPMGGMGGAGMGDSAGSRRIPAWLVEHQDVWGASVQAAPGLIGDS
jgi:uncharacterized protein YukE